MEQYRLMLLHALLTEAMIDTDGPEKLRTHSTFRNARVAVVGMIGREPTVGEVEEANDVVTFACLAFDVNPLEDLTIIVEEAPPIPHLCGDCAKVCGDCLGVYCVMAPFCPTCHRRKNAAADLGWGPGVRTEDEQRRADDGFDDYAEPL